MEQETLKALKAEMPYQWRVQECKEYGANCVAYIDSRDVQNRLDEVVGQGNWQDDYKEVKGNLYAGIAILVNGQWIWKWDCGTESNVEKEKGEASDSFKRAAVKWGIGRFLYDLEIVKLKTIQHTNQKYYPKNEKTGRPIFDRNELTKYINDIKGQSKVPTTSYNHNEIGTPEKPLISNTAFSKACERIKNGELDVYQKVLDKYTLLDATQRNLFDKLYNTALKNLQTA